MVSEDVSNSKASYLCVKSTLSEDLETPDELCTALQYYGMNPTRETVSKHWKGVRMSFNEFDEIVSKEASQNDLMASFRKLDPSGSGQISKQLLIESLVNRGEKLPRDLVERYVNDPTFSTAENSFNYVTFLKESIKTSNALMQQVKDIVTENEQNFVVNSKTYTKERKKSPQKRQSKEEHQPVWKTQVFSKGAFFFEAESLISHQYNLEIQLRQRVEISIESLDNKTDCQLFIFKINDVAMNRNSESKYLLVERTPMTSQPNSNQRNVVSWTGYLDKGSYLLVPSTTGCKLRKRKSQPSPEVELVKVADHSVELSPRFCQVLTEIFDQIDLDKSGGLSRQEFNLFNWRTSGEEVQNDEWKVVEENFELVNGELSLPGFLKLHQMEADDNRGDSAELWVTLNAMGYNYNLVQDEAALFLVSNAE